MRIKPYFILGLAVICSSVGMAILITVSDPYTVRPEMLVLFWVSLFLTVWGLIGTILTGLHQRLSLALWVGFLWAAAAVGFMTSFQQGYRSSRLSAVMIGTTIVLTLVLVWRMRRYAHVHGPPEPNQK